MDRTDRIFGYILPEETVEDPYGIQLLDAGESFAWQARQERQSRISGCTGWPDIRIMLTRGGSREPHWHQASPRWRRSDRGSKTTRSSLKKSYCLKKEFTKYLFYLWLTQTSKVRIWSNSINGAPNQQWCPLLRAQSVTKSGLNSGLGARKRNIIEILNTYVGGSHILKSIS